MAPTEGRDAPYSPPVNDGIVHAIWDYEGHWPVPADSVEDDYSEDSFA